MNNYDIVIIGGGLSGNMMAKRVSMLLPSSKIAIIDRGDSNDHSFHLHRPINELSVDFSPKNFFLGIWDDAGMHSSINPMYVNQYAYKVYDKLQPSNIINFSQQQHSQIFPVTKSQLLKALENGATQIQSEVLAIDTILQRVITKDSGYTYKYLINTISLPVFLRLCGIETTLQFNSHSFNIHAIPAGYNTGLFQMIYNVDRNCAITRATLIDEMLYIESNAHYQDSDYDMIEYVFGSKFLEDMSTTAPKLMAPGRFDPLSREDRKNLIFYLTNKFNILLLGRYGSWTFKVANDVWDDTQLLCEIISYKENTEKGASICKH